MIIDIEYRHVSHAVTINCNTENEQCQNTLISCSPNEDCDISCDGVQACYGSTINCPINGDCDITCKGIICFYFMGKSQ